MRDLYEQVLAEQQWIEQLHIKKGFGLTGNRMCINHTPQILE